MSNDINKVILIGRLTREPELKYIPSGTAIANFSLASNKSFTQNGEKKESTSFFNCIAWGKLGEIMAQYCKKGHRIGIEGKLQQRSWEDKDGNKRSVVEIVVDNFQVLDSKKDDDSGDNAGGNPVPEDDQQKPFDPDSIPFN